MPRTLLGATALMWGTGDAAKVRLLLERGASVNEKTKDGVTALVDRRPAREPRVGTNTVGAGSRS